MTIDQASVFEVSADLIRLVGVSVMFFLIYFFSFHLQVYIARFAKFFSEKIGVYSTSKEFVLQRYVYQHSDGLVAKFYW